MKIMTSYVHFFSGNISWKGFNLGPIVRLPSVLPLSKPHPSLVPHVEICVLEIVYHSECLIPASQSGLTVNSWDMVSNQPTIAL